jgi:hypothetical protein
MPRPSCVMGSCNMSRNLKSRLPGCYIFNLSELTSCFPFKLLLHFSLFLKLLPSPKSTLFFANICPTCGKYFFAQYIAQSIKSNNDGRKVAGFLTHWAVFRKMGPIHFRLLIDFTFLTSHCFSCNLNYFNPKHVIGPMYHVESSNTHVE